MDARPPRFRRLPFVRDGISDLGRASAPRMTAPHMLPSTGQTVSASATLILSRLNSPPHTIAVYASPPPSPAQLQHSLPGGPLRPYPRGTFTRWNAPASPGAPDPVFQPRIHEEPFISSDRKRGSRNSSASNRAVSRRSDSCSHSLFPELQFQICQLIVQLAAMMDLSRSEYWIRNLVGKNFYCSG